MGEPLESVSGIGPKTAKELRERGIDDTDDLAKAYDEGLPLEKLSNKTVKRRAASLARKRYARGGRYEDPQRGVTVTDENVGRVNKLEDVSLSSMFDFKGDSPGSWDSWLDAGASASKGDALRTLQGRHGSLKPFQNVRIDPSKERSRNWNESGYRGREIDDARKNAESSAARVQRSLDAAKNITGLDRGELLDLNLAKGYGSHGFKFEYERDYSELEYSARKVSPLDYLEALRFNNNRSRKSRRKDAAKKAPKTGDVEAWESDPSHLDFPGVDTRRGVDALVGNAEGFMSSLGRVGFAREGAKKELFGDTKDDVEEALRGLF